MPKSYHDYARITDAAYDLNIPSDATHVYSIARESGYSDGQAISEIVDRA